LAVVLIQDAVQVDAVDVEVGVADVEVVVKDQ
jgi:hypothetical protein